MTASYGTTAAPHWLWLRAGGGPGDLRVGHADAVWDDCGRTVEEFLLPAAGVPAEQVQAPQPPQRDPGLLHSPAFCSLLDLLHLWEMEDVTAVGPPHSCLIYTCRYF